MASTTSVKSRKKNNSMERVLSSTDATVPESRKRRAIASLFQGLCSDSDEEHSTVSTGSEPCYEELPEPSFSEAVENSAADATAEADGGKSENAVSYTNAKIPKASNLVSDVEKSEKEEPEQSSLTSFRELGVCEELCAACAALGWSKPTEIQAASLPHALAGRDIIGLAETGSGKTGAFAIPMMQKLLENPRHRGVAVLVLAPTRELTVQIAEQFQALGCSIGLKVCTIVGGLDMVAQAMELTKKPHVVVGTPGRVVDHLENTKGFSLGSILSLVMDEADRLLSMDFEDALNKILDVLPKERNTYLFSATMTSRVSKLQRASLVNPVKVSVNSKYETAKNLVQSMKIVSHKYKWTYCIALLTHLKAYTCIVFTNTCLDAKRLAICLRHLGFSSVCLHGKMTQPQRLGALNGFKAGCKRVLIATEVGSRGLDIPHVDVVVNFDVPLGSKDYIHRVGRTARAGKTGRAITLVTQYDAETYLKIEQALGKKLEVYQDVTEDMWEPLMGKVEEARRATEQEIKETAVQKTSTGKKPGKKRRH